MARGLKNTCPGRQQKEMAAWCSLARTEVESSRVGNDKCWKFWKVSGEVRPWSEKGRKKWPRVVEVVERGDEGYNLGY